MSKAGGSPKCEEIWEICQGSCCLKLSCKESVWFSDPRIKLDEFPNLEISPLFFWNWNWALPAKRPQEEQVSSCARVCPQPNLWLEPEAMETWEEPPSARQLNFRKWINPGKLAWQCRNIIKHPSLPNFRCFLPANDVLFSITILLCWPEKNLRLRRAQTWDMARVLEFGIGIIFVGKGQVTLVDNIDMVAIGSTLSDNKWIWFLKKSWQFVGNKSVGYLGYPDFLRLQVSRAK